MKILYLHNSIIWGGADRSLFELATSIKSKISRYILYVKRSTANIYEANDLILSEQQD
jgi:hypothetical protein